MKQCDNLSVGVIIRNNQNEIALLKRARFPVGIAPPAGHIDDHGSAERTATDEAYEELGLKIAQHALKITRIQDIKVNNPCRRMPGENYHYWWIFETDQYTGEPTPNQKEAKSVDWYNQFSLQELADRTRAYQAGKIPQVEWETRPGLEEVWLNFFVELGYVH